METTGNGVICKARSTQRSGFRCMSGLKRQDDLAVALRQGVFQGFSHRDIRRLCKTATKGSLNRYDLLLKANDQNQSLFLITKGACLTRHGKNFFAEIEQGHFVGEISFLTGNAVSVDVVARTEIEYLQWDREQLERKLGKRSQLRSRFFGLLGEHMANRLWYATEKLIAA